jgi:hypothetical protein
VSLGDLIEGDPLGDARPDGARCQQAEEPLQRSGPRVRASRGPRTGSCAWHLRKEATRVQRSVDAHGTSPWADGPRVEPGHKRVNEPPVRV